MKNIFEKVNIRKNVETLRTAMIKSGMENGLNHPITIKLSQNLDKLLSEYSLTFSN
ncbi:aspartyl-phosphate phosphatase Spo0E family protein [Solibacillus silvestris]